MTPYDRRGPSASARGWKVVTSGRTRAETPRATPNGFGTKCQRRRTYAHERAKHHPVYGGGTRAGTRRHAAGGRAAHTPPPQNQQGGGGRHGLAGAITAVSPGTIVISDRSGKTVTVKMTPTTRILKPTEVTLADVKTGEPVQIFAEPSQGGPLVARAIELNPMPMGGRPMRGGGQSVDGTVAQIAAGTLTVKRPDGTTVSVGLTQQTRIGTLAPQSPNQLTVGTRVMVQGPTNTDGTVTAMLILVANFQRR